MISINMIVIDVSYTGYDTSVIYLYGIYCICLLYK